MGDPAFGCEKDEWLADKSIKRALNGNALFFIGNFALKLHDEFVLFMIWSENCFEALWLRPESTQLFFSRKLLSEFMKQNERFLHDFSLMFSIPRERRHSWSIKKLRGKKIPF